MDVTERRRLAQAGCEQGYAWAGERGWAVGRGLGLDYDGDDHGAAAVVVADPLADDAAGELADLVGVGDAVGGGQGEGLLDLGQDLGERGVVDAGAAGVDLRAGHHLAGVGVDHDHHRDEALVAEDAPVLELRLGDLADGQAVDVDVPARDRADHVGHAVHQVDHHAVLGEHDVVVGHAGQRGQVGVRAQVPPLAVHRHEVARLDQVEHVEQLAGRRVAGDVHLGHALVHDARAEPGQPVDHPVHGGLVAGDQRRGQDDGVPGGDPDRVVAAGHPGQRGHRLALRAGGDQHDLAGRHLLGLARVDQQPAGHPQVAEVAGDAHVAHHRPADEGDLAAVLDRGVEHLLHPVHVGGEAGDDDALLVLAKISSSTGPISRSGVTKPGTSALVESAISRSTPSVPSRAKPARSVSRPSSGSWSILKSPVCSTRPAGVRMATASASGMEWLTAKNSQSNGPERLRSALDHLDRDGSIRCSASLPHQGQGELRADQRDVAALAEQVRHRADVVLVAVGEHQRLDVGPAGPSR